MSTRDVDHGGVREPESACEGCRPEEGHYVRACPVHGIDAAFQEMHERFEVGRHGRADGEQCS